jgi:hypothetical protein
MIQRVKQRRKREEGEKVPPTFSKLRFDSKQF